MVESLEDLDDNRVCLATGVDESSIAMPLPLDEQRVNCNIEDTQKQTKNNTTRGN